MFDPKLLRLMGLLPNEYLYYYYHREKALANIQKAGAARGETIETINRHMMEELKTWTWMPTRRERCRYFCITCS